jgi:cytochrome P450
MAAGMIVIANTATANRDPAVCADPDRLDITREASPCRRDGSSMPSNRHWDV